jgi:hypothetical protein
MNPAENVGALCRELDRTVDQYRTELARKAETESDFKRDRAKRIIRARVEGEATSAAQAETVADADDAIAKLRLDYLIAEGIAASTKEKIASLKERIGYGRSLMATEREQDRLHTVRGDVA